MASEAELCLHRCCFTGHRPEKLKRNERDIKAALREQIDQAVDYGLTVFITGMARGVDYGKQRIMRSASEKALKSVQFSK